MSRIEMRMEEMLRVGKVGLDRAGKEHRIDVGDITSFNIPHGLQDIERWLIDLKLSCQ